MDGTLNCEGSLNPQAQFMVIMVAFIQLKCQRTAHHSLPPAIEDETQKRSYNIGRLVRDEICTLWLDLNNRLRREGIKNAKRMTSTIKEQDHRLVVLQAGIEQCTTERAFPVSAETENSALTFCNFG